MRNMYFEVKLQVLLKTVLSIIKAFTKCLEI